VANPVYGKKSFGYFGGPNCRMISHPVTAAGYHAKVCCLCPKVALYRVGRDGYCKDHREDAIKRRKNWQLKFAEPQSAAYERRGDTRDRQQKANERRIHGPRRRK